MADAIPQHIPLVSLGGAVSGQEPVHDWHFVFSELHLLNASYFIGAAVRFIGMFTAFLGIMFTAWLLYKMAATPAQPQIATDTVPAVSHLTSIADTPKSLHDRGFTSLPFDDHNRKPPATI